MIRAKSKENDLEGAMQVFRKLRASGVQLTSLVYNALLDSCVQAAPATHDQRARWKAVEKGCEA